MNTHPFIYVVEVNLICIIVLALIFQHVARKTATDSFQSSLLKKMIASCVVFSISDMIATIIAGQVFTGAIWLSQIINIVYFISLNLISYGWYLYVKVELNSEGDFSVRYRRKAAIPLIAFIVVAVTNPFTKVLFKISADNVYSRSWGVALHWIVNWGYVLVATYLAVKTLRDPNKTPQEKADIIPLITFLIPVTVAAILQMVFYGLTTTQVGITISLLFHCMSQQNMQIVRDELTKLNNKRAMNQFVSDNLQKGNTEQTCVLMMDINHFKEINDTYGHLVGDHALIDAAEVLKNAISNTQRPVFLCRYGGDEFVMIALGMNAMETEELENAIRIEADRFNAENDTQYNLEFSVGSGIGKCLDFDDVEHLIRVADEAMYMDKKRLNALRK